MHSFQRVISLYIINSVFFIKYLHLLCALNQNRECTSIRKLVGRPLDFILDGLRRFMSFYVYATRKKNNLNIQVRASIENIMLPHFSPNSKHTNQFYVTLCWFNSKYSLLFTFIFMNEELHIEHNKIMRRSQQCLNTKFLSNKLIGVDFEDFFCCCSHLYFITCTSH